MTSSYPDSFPIVIPIFLLLAFLSAPANAQSVGINTETPLTILDVRGTDDTSDGATLQLTTPNQTNYLRFFGGRLGDRNPFIAFHDSDTLHFVSTLPDFSTYARRVSVLPDGKVGVGTNTPTQMFEVAGPLKIGDDVGDIPTEGTIRWNDSNDDFEGYTGTKWVSLTNSSEPSGSGVVTDIDGNEYLTVTIGTQTWMRENLRTTRYRNGEPIPEVLLGDDWTGLSTGAWCWYDHDPEKDKPYGKLYNWYAVADTNGLCPTGWHVPSESEWTTLTDYLGGPGVAGSMMKTTGTIESDNGFWLDPNPASNESGFTGYPGGFRQPLLSTFVFIGVGGYWWSSTELNSSSAMSCALVYDAGNVTFSGGEKPSGYSIRCVKD